MGWRLRKPIRAGQECQRCRLRYQQGHGLCRQCARAFGDTRGNVEREAERIARREAHIVRVVSAQQAPKYREADGKFFEIVFDGTRVGSGSREGLLPHAGKGWLAGCPPDQKRKRPTA